MSILPSAMKRTLASSGPPPFAVDIQPEKCFNEMNAWLLLLLLSLFLSVSASRVDARTSGSPTRCLEPHHPDNASTESSPSQLPDRTPSEPRTERRKSGRDGREGDFFTTVPI